MMGSVPFASGPVRFLGMQVQIPRNKGVVREELLSRLQKMLTAIHH